MHVWGHLRDHSRVSVQLQQKCDALFVKRVWSADLKDLEKPTRKRVSMALNMSKITLNFLSCVLH